VNLDTYDYGARMYDPALGRWHVVDPFAEKHISWSVDNYLLNNPILLIGRDVGDSHLPNTLDCELAYTTNKKEYLPEHLR